MAEQRSREALETDNARLRATEGRLRTILEEIATAFAIVEVRFDGDDRPVDYHSLEANSAFERQSGVDLTGRWVTEYAPDLERVWFDTYGHVASTGEPAAFESYASTFERWFDVRAIRVGDPADRTIAIFFNDSTARKQAEQQLLEHNDTLEQQDQDRTAELNRLWETSPDLLLIIDFDGVFRRVNPAWTTMLDYLPEELVGHHVNDFVLPDDHDETVEAYTLAAEGGSPRIVNRYRHKDGSTRWISWVAAPSGDVTYATGRDVTAERRHAAELAHAQDQLRQAQKVEAVGQLTGGVAHDFNNLLTVIRGSVDLLRRPNLSDERRERYIDAIAETADRATRLTSQLLAFARRQALVPETFDVGESLRRLTEMVGTLAGSRIAVDLKVAACPCHVHADRNQFDTAIINMAVNARDAMNGNGCLTIEVAAVSGMPAVRTHAAIEGAFIAIALKDTGEGIAPDQLERIFEPFYTTKSVGEGTGLGLSQVFGFAKQSGGEIVVESREGEGATFTLYLPEVAALVVDDPATAVPPPSNAGDAVCILVVEDNLQVGEFARSALAELGHTTVLARDAAEALGELGAAPDRFDIVFSDVVMPGMSGVELGQEIRRRYPHLPVVLASGYSNVLAQEGSHGFDLIHKPYSIEQLSTALGQAMTQRRRGP